MTLDAGNLFFDRDEIEAKQLELKQETARLIVDIYNNLKYDAYNVGGHDFALGLDFLKELQDQPIEKVKLTNNLRQILAQDKELLERLAQ